MTKQQQNLIVNLRQKLHQCPEISGQEVRTKALLQQLKGKENKTIAGKSYIYPIIPFSWKELKKRFFRGRLPVIPESQNVKR